MSRGGPADQAQSAANVIPLLGLLSSKGGKFERAVAFAVAANTAYSAVKKVYKARTVKTTYSVTVNGEDTIYPDVHAWVIANLPEEEQRAVIVESSSEATIVSDSGDYEPSPLRMLFDGATTQFVNLHGHSIAVSVNSENADYLKRKRHEIKFTCPGVEARNAVVQLLRDISAARGTSKRKPRLYMARWGDWQRRDDLATRPLDSVVLAPGVKEGLVNDLEQFRARETDFVRMGIPYRRGYLLYGPPGSGKTSIAKALASHFNMDVYFMSLSDMENDSHMIQLISRVPSGSMLLLEDVDVASATRVRDDSQTTRKGTLSGLLNSLDGVATPHGLVVVMTTNKREVLDPALLRAGRIDVETLIDYVTPTQVREIFRTFTGEAPDFSVQKSVSSSDVVGVILKHLDKPNVAIDEVRAMIE